MKLKIRSLLSLLLVFSMLFSISSMSFATEIPKIMQVSVEYSDNRGEEESLYLLKQGDKVYVDAFLLAYRFGLTCSFSESNITLIRKGTHTLPLNLTQFIPNETTVNQMILGNFQTFEAPFSSMIYDERPWIPLEFALLMLNSSVLIFGDTLLFDTPQYDILDVIWELYLNQDNYLFDFTKDIGYSEFDITTIGISSHLTNFLDGILKGEGSSWLALAQMNYGESTAFHLKYGQTLATLMATESASELDAMVSQLKNFQDIFLKEGKLGNYLYERSVGLDVNVGTLSDTVDVLFDRIQYDNDAIDLYNSTFKQLETAFAKQELFDSTAGYLLEIQKGLSETDAPDFLDTAFTVAEIIGYQETFASQDQFAIAALDEALKNEISQDFILDDLRTAMQIEVELLKTNWVAYSAKEILSNNLAGFITKHGKVSQALGAQANAALLVWDLASTFIPFLSDALESTELFELALYGQQFQGNARHQFREDMSTYSTGKELNPDDLYQLSQKAYVLFKSAYTTRDAALGSLEGKRDSLLDKIQDHIETQQAVNAEIGTHMNVLKNATMDNENFVYGFLPSENEKYLENYNGSALSTFCEENGEFQEDEAEIEDGEMLPSEELHPLYATLLENIREKKYDADYLFSFQMFSPDLTNMGYALLDVNGDGIDELFIGFLDTLSDFMSFSIVNNELVVVSYIDAHLGTNFSDSGTYYTWYTSRFEYVISERMYAGGSSEEFWETPMDVLSSYTYLSYDFMEESEYGWYTTNDPDGFVTAYESQNVNILQRIPDKEVDAFEERMSQPYPFDFKPLINLGNQATNSSEATDYFSLTYDIETISFPLPQMAEILDEKTVVNMESYGNYMGNMALYGIYAGYMGLDTTNYMSAVNSAYFDDGNGKKILFYENGKLDNTKVCSVSFDTEFSDTVLTYILQDKDGHKITLDIENTYTIYLDNVSYFSTRVYVETEAESGAYYYASNFHGDGLLTKDSVRFTSGGSSNWGFPAYHYYINEMITDYIQVNWDSQGNIMGWNYR